MPDDIPQDQLERIRPMLDQVLSAFRKLEITLPLDADSALTYRVDSEEHQ